MSDTLDMATLLRNKANSARNKSNSRVSQTTLLAKITEFLNDDDMQFASVENLYPAGTKHSSIVARFRSIIVENKMDELVYPVNDENHVDLVKLVGSES